MKIGVVVFPGSNCDHDAFYAAGALAGQEATFLWHESADLEGVDAILIPGGFSYGDYLRTGAIAHFAPVMESIKRFARAGNPVLGICNGFQILCESGLLPGALMRNSGLRYRCKQVYLRVEATDTPFTQSCRNAQVLRVPIAHNDGNYFADDATLAQLQQQRRIVFRYATAQGAVTAEANPNGSRDNIAGICSEGRNVVGMMPHPERACEPELGSADGFWLFRSLVDAFAAAAVSGKAR